MPRKWTAAHLKVAQEHLSQREDKREERLRKDEEERQEHLSQREEWNQKRLVAGSKRKKSKAIRRPKAKGQGLTGSFDDAVQKLNRGLDRGLEGNRDRYGVWDVDRVALEINRLRYLLVHERKLEKASKIPMSPLIRMCTDPNLTRFTRSKAVDILRRFPEIDTLAHFVAVVREPEQDQGWKTCAALSLIWFDTPESISALIGLVDELTDSQKNECIPELRRICSDGMNLALSVFQRHLPSTPKVPPLRADQPDTNELSWTILPIGWWGIPSYQRLATQKSRDRRSGELVLERLRFLDELNPKERYIGRDRFGSDPYWVFIFDKHVVAECPMEGNAVYIVDGIQDWRTLLNRSKKDLKVVAPNRYKRIVHRGDWKSRVINTLGTDVHDLR